jgi:flagellar hook protein FlgE
MDPLSASGLRGIHSGLARAADAAQSFSEAFTPASTTDITEAAISLIGAQHEIAASSKVVTISQDIQKSVLDILA